MKSDFANFSRPNNISGPAGTIHPETMEVDWTAFYNRCFSLMTRYALRAGLRGADAEDVVANAMKKLFLLVSERRIQTDVSIKGYLAVMIRHEVYDYYQTIKEFYGNGLGMLCDAAKPEVQFEFGKYDENGEVSDVEVRHKLETLTQAMQLVRSRVAEKSWQMFCEVTIEGAQPQEVAEKLGVKIQTVYQRNFQIKRMIREASGMDVH